MKSEFAKPLSGSELLCLFKGMQSLFSAFVFEKKKIVGCKVNRLKSEKAESGRRLNA